MNLINPNKSRQKLHLGTSPQVNTCFVSRKMDYSILSFSWGNIYWISSCCLETNESCSQCLIIEETWEDSSCFPRNPHPWECHPQEENTIWLARLSILLIKKSHFNFLALCYVNLLSILCLNCPHCPSLPLWLSQDLLIKLTIWNSIR